MVLDHNDPIFVVLVCDLLGSISSSHLVSAVVYMCMTKK